MLLARANAFLRRTKQDETHTHTFGNFTLDIDARELTQNGQSVKLSPKEFKKLAYFLTHSGRALTRDTLLNAVWGYNNFVTSRSVDRCITTLRTKIEPNPAVPQFIHTIREIGYKFSVSNKVEREPTKAN